MLLDECFDYKNKLMETLCKNERIVHLITDSEQAPVPNYDLAYTQIYPFEFVPETADKSKTYVCFEVTIPRVMDKVYYKPMLNIWIIVHKSKMRLEEGGVRMDQLAIEINKELSGNRCFGLGELELNSVGCCAPLTDYRGRVLTYSAKDFNRPGVSRKPPANRKDRE